MENQTPQALSKSNKQSKIIIGIICALAIVVGLVGWYYFNPYGENPRSNYPDNYAECLRAGGILEGQETEMPFDDKCTYKGRSHSRVTIEAF